MKCLFLFCVYSTHFDWNLNNYPITISLIFYLIEKLLTKHVRELSEASFLLIHLTRTGTLCLK